MKQDIRIRIVKPKDRIRYWLHGKIRKQGFDLVTRHRTIYHDADKPMKESKYVARLTKEFGYAVQLKNNDKEN